MSHVELNRGLSDWLNGSTLDYQGNPQGIGVQLVTLFNSGTHTDSGDARPNAPTVYDETRSAPVSRNEPPVTTEATVSVSVLSSSVAATYMSQPPRIGTATVLLRYVGKNSDTDEGVEDAFYIMRAILMSLAVLFNGYNSAARTRNGVTFFPTEEIGYEPMVAQREDSSVSLGLLLTLNTRSTP